MKRRLTVGKTIKVNRPGVEGIGVLENITMNGPTEDEVILLVRMSDGTLAKCYAKDAEGIEDEPVNVEVKDGIYITREEFRKRVLTLSIFEDDLDDRVRIMVIGDRIEEELFGEPERDD